MTTPGFLENQYVLVIRKFMWLNYHMCDMFLAIVLPLRKPNPTDLVGATIGQPNHKLYPNRCLYESFSIILSIRYR